MDNNMVATIQSGTQELIAYNEEQVKLIKNMYAKNFTNDELSLMMYMSKQYGLDILTKQIWGVKFGSGAAQIYTGRDGFLEIAHRSGKFDGMDSGTTGSVRGKDLKGWCKVYRKDMAHPFTVEVDFDEYSTGKSLWVSKPKTMIQKVAESQCLRRAFSISGIYAPEEMSQWEEENKSKGKLPENKGPKMMEKSQKAAVWKMAQLKGMDLEQLKKFTEDNMLNGLDHLTYDQAEQLIKIISSYEHTVEEKQDEIIADADFEEVIEDGEVTETEF